MKRLQLKTFLNKIFSCTPFQKYHASPLLYNFNKHTLLLSFSYVLFYINTYFVYLNYWFISSYFRIEIKRLFLYFCKYLLHLLAFFLFGSCYLLPLAICLFILDTSRSFSSFTGLGPWASNFCKGLNSYKLTNKFT